GIYKTNEVPQEIEIDQERNLVEELGVQNFSRIKQIQYSLNPNNPNSLKVYINLHYELDDPSNTSVELKVANFSYNDEESFNVISKSFSQMKQISLKEYEFYMPLNYDYNYNIGHNAYLRLIGAENRAIGKETKTYLNSVNHSKEE
ncbi:MAG: hypothetical protein KC478_17735, partial [Bacteriovoracaceae bacterium]|nr:hypothetical protein [Bacteriovoracaceae bacterium]